MKLLRISAVTILLLCTKNLSAQKPQSDAITAIEGVVLSAVSGDPIAGARVSLLKDPGIVTRSGSSEELGLPPELDSHYLSKWVYSDSVG